MSFSSPPRWLMVLLMGCLSLLLVLLLSDPQLAGAPAEAATAPAATLAPSPTPEPTPEPTPSPTPEPDWSLPVPLGEAVEPEEWFSDAVFIGDSRTDGLKLYSGIPTAASFLDYTGLTVYDVLEGKKVIRSGPEKLSILDALAEGSYGKVYISLGVNELGYYDPEGFSQAYGQILDAIQALQPQARLYVQAIFPVNAAKCKANDTPYYVTNEQISAYNAVLPALCQEKKVRFLDIPAALVDEDGESPTDLSADGVHFKREGYVLWLDHLITHTGQ